MSVPTASLRDVKAVAKLLGFGEEYVRDRCRLPNPDWEHERFGSGPRPRIKFTDAQVEAIVAMHHQSVPATSSQATGPVAVLSDQAEWDRALARRRRDAKAA